MRQLHLADGTVVRYQIFKSGTIMFFTPDKHVTNMSKVTGMPWDVVEHDSNKCNLHVTPQQCKDYIQGVLDREQ